MNFLAVGVDGLIGRASSLPVCEDLESTEAVIYTYFGVLRERGISFLLSICSTSKHVYHLYY